MPKSLPAIPFLQPVFVNMPPIALAFDYDDDDRSPTPPSPSSLSSSCSSVTLRGSYPSFWHGSPNSDRSVSPGLSPCAMLGTVSPTRGRRTKGASTDPKHSVGRNHICGQCNARFLCKSKLDRHVLTHTGAKPFDCFCGKRFNQKSALKNHTRRHLRKRDHLFDAERCGLNGFSHESLSPESVQHFP